MTEGLRALVAAATQDPLPFRIRMYVGTLLLTGQIAPAHWWYDLTRRAMEAELEKYQAKLDEAEASHQGRFRPLVDPQATHARAEQARASLAALRTAQDADRDTAEEVTLVDVRIYPADFRKDTKTGSQNLAVVRIPLSSVSLWWIVEEETVPGSKSTGSAWGVGVIFPIG
jgi:hypothetical protein